MRSISVWLTTHSKRCIVGVGSWWIGSVVGWVLDLLTSPLASIIALLVAMGSVILFHDLCLLNRIDLGCHCRAGLLLSDFGCLYSTGLLLISLACRCRIGLLLISLGCSCRTALLPTALLGSFLLIKGLVAWGIGG
jgi:hypothetical protein